MSTDLVELPIVPGTLGPSIATDAFQTEKTMLLYGVIGAVTVEASADGELWCPVDTFAEGQRRDKVALIEAAFMRTDARRGSATQAFVSAETGVTCSAAIPPPLPNGPGMPLDIINFGPSTTVYVKGIDTRFEQSVSIEISLDGTRWSPDFKTFTRDGCFTKNIPARYIRAVGKGNVNVDVGVCSQKFGMDPSNIDLVSLIQDGNLLQLATYDDETQTLLFQINQVLEQILATRGEY